MTERSKRCVLAVLAFSQLIVVLDASIVNIALPHIEASLHFGRDQLQWVVNAYALVFGGCLLLGGRLADRLGRRRIFVVGILMFCAATAFAGFSTSAAQLVSARAIQGLGAALLSPAALSLLSVVFQEGNERDRALGVWGAVAASGAALGVVVGGVIVQYVSWRWVFFVNIPICVIALAGTLKFVPESRSQTKYPFDVLGAVSITGGLIALVCGLVRGNDIGWTTHQTASTFALAIALLSLFVVIEHHATQPLVRFVIFENLNVTSSNLGSLLVGAGMFGMLFFVSLYLQQILHYSAVRSGLSLLPVSAVIAVSAGVASELMRKLGARAVTVLSMGMAATGMALLMRMHPGGSYLGTVLLPLTIFAVGIGFAAVSLSSSALAGVDEEDMGLASALLNTSEQVGGAVGLGLLTGVSSTRFSHLAAHLRAPSELARATTSGWDWGFGVGTLLFLLGLIIALFVSERAREYQGKHFAEHRKISVQH